MVETCACCILPGRHEKQRTIPPRNSQAGHPILDPRRSTAPLFSEAKSTARRRKSRVFQRESAGAERVIGLPRRTLRRSARGRQ